MEILRGRGGASARHVGALPLHINALALCCIFTTLCVDVVIVANITLLDRISVFPHRKPLTVA